ncbi:hypothetical protein PV328_011666, partial [Microctonus aethiopoides]
MQKFQRIGRHKEFIQQSYLVFADKLIHKEKNPSSNSFPEWLQRVCKSRRRIQLFLETIWIDCNDAVLNLLMSEVFVMIPQ